MSPTPDSALSPSGALAAFLSEREPAEADRLLLELRRLAMTYKFGIDEVMTKISILRDEFRHLRNYNPVEHVASRLKSFDSILDKCRRKDIPVTPEAIRENILDIAGVRVTCSFVSDIYRVRDMLAGQSDLTVLEERDYIAEPKANGYKSLHLIVKVPVFLSDRVGVLSRRPGSLVGIEEVDLARPRRPELEDDPAFFAIETSLRRLLHEGNAA